MTSPAAPMWGAPVESVAVSAAAERPGSEPSDSRHVLAARGETYPVIDSQHRPLTEAGDDG